MDIQGPISEVIPRLEAEIDEVEAQLEGHCASMSTVWMELPDEDRLAGLQSTWRELTAELVTLDQMITRLRTEGKSDVQVS